MDIQSIIKILERAFLPCSVKFTNEGGGLLFFTLQMTPGEKQWSLKTPNGCAIRSVYRYGDTYTFSLELDTDTFNFQSLNQ